MARVPPPPQFRPGAPEHAPAPAPASAPPSAPRGRAGWPPWLSLAAFAAGFGITIVLGIVVIVGVGVFGVSENAAGLNIGLTLMQNIALVGAAYAFAALQGRPAAADFGLRPAPLWRSAGLLVAVWIGFFVLSAIWAAALGLHEQQKLPEELGADGPLANVLAVVVLITVFAPLGEELFFRGFFFGALRNWRGPWVAAVLTGLVFGAIHIGSSPVGYLVPLAFFGIGLCLLYEWTGSLYPAIALHALNNSIALGANLDWSWQIPVMMVLSPPCALACAWLLARAIGDGQRPEAVSAPAPGPV
jgi:membrane protease YdiL (CAAX protease family)